MCRPRDGSVTTICQNLAPECIRETLLALRHSEGERVTPVIS